MSQIKSSYQKTLKLHYTFGITRRSVGRGLGLRSLAPGQHSFELRPVREVGEMGRPQ